MSPGRAAERPDGALCVCTDATDGRPRVEERRYSGSGGIMGLIRSGLLESEEVTEQFKKKKKLKKGGVWPVRSPLRKRDHHHLCNEALVNQFSVHIGFVFLHQICFPPTCYIRE